MTLRAGAGKSGSKTSKKGSCGGKRKKRTHRKGKKKGGSLFDVAKKYKVVSNVAKTLADNGVPYANDVADVAKEKKENGRWKFRF